MPLQKHTVSIWLVEKYRDSTMALVTDAETVVDGEAVATATATRRRST
jgi:hypothetical protein